MKRGDFIKNSCSLCLLAAGSIYGIDSLTSCSQFPIYKTSISENKISVPLSLFSQTDLQIIRPGQIEYDIALHKEPDGTFTALLLRCTHADNQLTMTGNGFICNLHGSIFNKEGNVMKGPANRSLRKFETRLVPGIEIIILIS
jgi:Rieske Fe-S protein